MPKSEKQKLKLYYLYKIMLEQTDDLHSLTMAQIVEELEEYGISAERKSIYRDFDILTNDMDLEIIKEQPAASPTDLDAKSRPLSRMLPQEHALRDPRSAPTPPVEQWNRNRLPFAAVERCEDLHFAVADV